MRKSFRFKNLCARFTGKLHRFSLPNLIDVPIRASTDLPSANKPQTSEPQSPSFPNSLLNSGSLITVPPLRAVPALNRDSGFSDANRRRSALVRGRIVLSFRIEYLIEREMPQVSVIRRLWFRWWCCYFWKRCAFGWNSEGRFVDLSEWRGRLDYLRVQISVLKEYEPIDSSDLLHLQIYRQGGPTVQVNLLFRWIYC